MTEIELKKQIKSGELSGLYYFSGDETFMRDYYAAEIKKAVVGDGMEEFNLNVYDDRTFSTADIENAVSSYPMMSDRKMILFRDTGILGKSEEDKEFFVELFQDIPDYVVMVVCERQADKTYSPYKALKKYAKCVDFPYRKADDLKPWLARAAQRADKSLAAPDINYLIEHCGPSMANLRSEFQKVVAYVGARKEITRKDIDACITLSDEYQIYLLTDAVFDRKSEKAYQILREFKQKAKDNPAQKVIASFGYSYADMLRAKMLLSEGSTDSEIIAALSGPDFVRKKSLRFAQKVSENYLKCAVEAVKEADLKSKSGALEEWAAVEMLIARMMAMQR